MRLKFGLVVFVVLACMQVLAAPQKIKSLNTTAKGQGTITISDPLSGEKKHDVNSVVVILRANGDAEIVLVTEMQLFARGRWSAPSDLSKGISLKINGGIVTGNATGSGKLLLRPDARSIDRLNFDAKGAARSKVTVQFVADKEAS
jgi:hypothetical protein